MDEEGHLKLAHFGLEVSTLLEERMKPWAHLRRRVYLSYLR